MFFILKCLCKSRRAHKICVQQCLECSTQNSHKKKFTLPFKLCRVSEADYHAVVAFLKKYYYSEEPVTVAAKLRNIDDVVQMGRIDEVVRQRISVLAKLKSDNSIIGIAVNVKTCPWDISEMKMDIGKYKDPSARKLLKFWTSLKNAPNIYDKYSVPLVFEIDKLATYPMARGSGMASTLIAESRKLAKQLGYPLVRVDATNRYAAMICERQKMKLEAVYPYKLIRGADNKPIFLPEPPHTEIRVYVERF